MFGPSRSSECRCRPRLRVASCFGGHAVATNSSVPDILPATANITSVFVPLMQARQRAGSWTPAHQPPAISPWLGPNDAGTAVIGLRKAMVQRRQQFLILSTPRLFFAAARLCKLK